MVWRAILVDCSRQVRGLPEEHTPILHDLFDHFGPIPRVLFDELTLKESEEDSSLQELIDVYEASLKDEMIELLKQGSAALHSQFPSTNSHSIVLLKPDFKLNGHYQHIS